MERGPRVTAAELYHEAIVDAARRAQGPGRLEHPHATATVDNPLCGDRVTIDVEVARGQVSAVGQRVRGCLLCEAAAALIVAHAPGEPASRLAEVQQAVQHLLEGGGAWPDHLSAWEAAGMFSPVSGFKSRHRCVMLPFEALAQALDDALGRRG